VRLIGKSEFARQCGVSTANIAKLIRNGKLTISDGKVDLEGDDTVEYLRKRAEVQSGDRPSSNRGGGVQPRQPVRQADDDSESQPGVMSRAQVDLMIQKHKLFAAEMKNKEKVGEVLSRSWFHRGIWQPIQTCWERMLTDFPRNLAEQLHPLIIGGLTKEETEAYIKKQMSSLISGAKDTCKRALEP
jgi:hypothetical protein